MITRNYIFLLLLYLFATLQETFYFLPYKNVINLLTISTVFFLYAPFQSYLKSKGVGSKYAFHLTLFIILFIFLSLFTINSFYEFSFIFYTSFYILFFAVLIPFSLPFELVINYLGVFFKISLIPIALYFFIEPSLSFESGRFRSFFQSSVDLSNYLLVALVFISSSEVFNKLSGFKSILIILFTLILIFLAGSRVVFFSSLLIILYSILLNLKFYFGSQFNTNLIFILFFLILLPIFFLIGSGEISFGYREEITNGFHDRFQHWSHALDRIYNSPYYGHGILFRFKCDDGLIGCFEEAKDPHNFFLNLALMLGFFPLIIVSYFLLFRVYPRIFSMPINHLSFIAISLFIFSSPLFIFGGNMFSPGAFFDKFVWLTIGYLFKK